MQIAQRKNGETETAIWIMIAILLGAASVAAVTLAVRVGG